LIVVYTAAGERVECFDATRFRTDEHNNLEIIAAGRNGQPIPVACFNGDHWERAVIEDGEACED